MVTLSILICSVPNRDTKISKLLTSLESQVLAHKGSERVEILVLRDNRERTIGSKRNALLQIAQGEYVAFVDDDDVVRFDYVDKIVEATRGTPDLITFEVWVSGYEHVAHESRVARFYPDLERDENTESEYKRLPNHIMVWRSEIAKKFPFDDVSYGEDGYRARRMIGAARSVVNVPEMLYWYRFDPMDNSMNDRFGRSAARSSVDSRRRRHEEQRPMIAREDMQEMNRETRLVSVLVPVLARPDNVKRLTDSFHATGSHEKANLYFIAQEGDDAEIEAIEREQAGGRCRLIMVTPDKQSWARKINEGYLRTREPWMLLVGDDVTFNSGWIDFAVRHMATGMGVIGTCDQAINSRRAERQRKRGRFVEPVSSPHPIVSRSYIDNFGTVDEPRKVVHDGYHHNFPDTELCATARIRNQFVMATDVIITHHHPIHVGGDDATYRLGRSRWSDDEATYVARRERFGFPFY